MNAWHEELERRCTGTNRAGERCARAPIPGGTTCVLHGGASANAQQAAKTRLLSMVEPVLGVFEFIVERYNSTRCVVCGKPTGDPMPVIRVGQLVLDRAGFHPSVTVAVEHVEPPDPYADLSLDQVIEKLERMLSEAVAMRDAQLPPADDALLLEGYVIPDEEPIPDGSVQFPEGTKPRDQGIGEMPDIPKENDDE